MDSLTWIAVASIVMAGLTTGFGTMGPALAEGRHFVDLALPWNHPAIGAARAPLASRTGAR